MQKTLKSIFTDIKLSGKDFLLIFSGAAMMGAGLRIFILPNKMALGGIPGIAIPLHFVSGLPTGLLILLINIPVFIVGIKKMGILFGFRTIIAVLLFSFFTDFFEQIIHIPQLTDEYILATLYGGTFLGIGMGLIFRAGASAGGISILAAIVSSKTHIKQGKFMMVMDLIIISAGSFYFGNPEIVLWGILITYIITQVIDFVLAGPPTGKIAQIFTEKDALISEKVKNELQRGGTIFEGIGIYTSKKRKMLMVALNTNQVIHLKKIVEKTDPGAFVVISNAYEITGQGFHYNK